MTVGIIDAHLHLWDLEGVGADSASAGGGTPARRAYCWLGPQHGILNRSYAAEEAQRTLAGAGIGGAVLVQADDTAADTASMLRVARENDWVLGVVGWIPLESPSGARAALDLLGADAKFKGIRHLVHDDPRNDFLDLPAVRESLAALAASGLAFDVPDAFPRHLGQTAQLARDVPGLTVVLDHLGKPPLYDDDSMPRWRQGFRALAELPNTVAKVSGLHRPGVPYTAAALRPVWEEALTAFGPDRLMFGGDWPVSLSGAPYAETAGVLFDLVSTLSAPEQSAVLRRTAARVYGLTVDASPPG